MRRFFLVFLLVLLLTAPALAHNLAEGGEDQSDTTGKVVLTEQLGKTIPLDLTFTESTGRQVQLRQLIDRPTLMVPVYYQCRNVCNFLLGALAEALPEIKLKAGEDYNIITFSIDPSETSVQAAHSKKTFLNAMQKPFNGDAWHFLTGDKDTILKLTDAAGYYYVKRKDDFLHPVAFFVVNKDGKILRYLIGQRVDPLDLTMALVEASEGVIGTPIRKALQFCFSYDPQGRKYVFNLLRVSATVILLTLGSFLLYLILSSRKKKK